MKTKTIESNGFQKRTVHNLVILDESGSMNSIKRATIQGFNEVVQTIKGVEKQFPEQEHFITFVTFNGLGIKTKLFSKKVKNLKEIDRKDYQPDSMTPLYDAIGLSVNKLRREIEAAKDCHVLVTILTDGEENASKEFSNVEIKKLVKELKKQDWTFTYMGANHDAEQVAFSLSITNSLKFEANEEDVKRVFAADKNARGVLYSKIRRGESVQDNYFEDEDRKKT